MRQRFISINKRLIRWIVSQCVMVIEIFVAQGQPIDALSQQMQLLMITALSSSRIIQKPGKSLGQSQFPISLPNQQTSSITGDVATGKINIDLSGFTGWK